MNKIKQLEVGIKYSQMSCINTYKVINTNTCKIWFCFSFWSPANSAHVLSHVIWEKKHKSLYTSITSMNN